MKAECAHCMDESQDDGKRLRCPACDEPICLLCWLDSTGTDCGHFAGTGRDEERAAKTAEYLKAHPDVQLPGMSGG